jgi:hypothetical protein
MSRVHNNQRDAILALSIWNDFMELTFARTIILRLATLLFFAVSVCGQTASVIPNRAAKEDDIREAVIRYQIRVWSHDGDKNETEANDEREKAIAQHLNSRTYFVLVNGQDPSDDFIARFRDISRPVKKASQANTQSRKSLWVTDDEMHQPGIIFSADEVRWTGDSSARIDGGYHCGGLCGGEIEFKVRFKKGKWIVDKNSRMKGIS